MSEIVFILDRSCEQPELADLHAVYEGHRYARELEAASTGEVIFKPYLHNPGEICLHD